MENTINTWAEAISALPDKDFFNLMRLYLGKIQTPYNKQRLASQLASFLKTPKNTKAILTLLTAKDLEFLSALYFMDGIDKESLLQFFSGSYQISEFYTRLANLRDRLLIYSVTKEDGKTYVLLNPVLLPSLEGLLKVEELLPRPQVMNLSMDDNFILTQEFLASFISCVRNNTFTLKNDGSLKKNAVNRLEEIFPSRAKCMELLMTAFLNLGLFHEGKKVDVDDDKLLKFAKLSPKQQYALLCAASSTHLSREGLRKQSQLLLDTIASIPQDGLTQKSILRLAFILGQKGDSAGAGSAALKGRFAQILEAARAQQKPQDAAQNKDFLDRMMDSAVEFGLIQKKGITTEGEEIYTAAEMQPLAPQNIKPVNIESAFSVSLMPGLSLASLLPLTHFLDVKSYGIVSNFEITKTSATSAFDSGMDVESIFKTLEAYCQYEIPQNMKVNIQEWYNSYSAAVLYHGFVLKVAPENIAFAENNPKIQKYVQEKLTDGIYLLNLPEDININAFFEECGLPAKNLKTAVTKAEVLDFPLLRDGRKPAFVTAAGQANGSLGVRSDSCPSSLSTEEGENLLLSLEKTLATMVLDKNQKENLANRIKNRLIVTVEQLSSEAIRTEILEAEGMDFSGKLHLIDAAIKEGDLLEIQMPQASGAGYATIVGTPRNLERTEGDAILTLAVKDEDEHLNINVSRITHLRRLHF